LLASSIDKAIGRNEKGINFANLAGRKPFLYFPGSNIPQKNHTDKQNKTKVRDLVAVQALICP